MGERMQQLVTIPTALNTSDSGVTHPTPCRTQIPFYACAGLSPCVPGHTPAPSSAHVYLATLLHPDGT